MTPNILHVEAMPDYDVLITYENGEKRIFSVKPYLGLGLFSELRDEAVFRSVRVSFDTISLDCVIGPRTLLIPCTGRGPGRSRSSRLASTSSVSLKPI